LFLAVSSTKWTFKQARHSDNERRRRGYLNPGGVSNVKMNGNINI
jgi:hypothetical protein